MTELVSTTIAAKKTQLLATQEVQDLVAFSQKVQVRVAPLAKSVRQQSRRVSRSCVRQLLELKDALRVPNPTTNPRFDGTKRYLQASVRGKSAQSIEASTRKKTDRFVAAQVVIEPLAKQTGSETPSQTNAGNDKSASLSMETARRFFDHVASYDDKEKIPYLQLLDLLRLLCGRAMTPTSAVDAFEAEIDRLESVHEITYSLTKLRFLQIATETIRDPALVDTVECALAVTPPAPRVARVVEETIPKPVETHDESETKELPLTECVEFRPDDEEIYHVGTAGLKARVLDGLEAMVQLRELHVRSNLLYKMTGIESLVNLTHLELYDNQIKKMVGLEKLVKLRVLDLSFNEIRSIPDLSHLTQLEELYVANNKLTHITGIGNLRTLVKLDLGANRIRTIEGLDHLENLEQLWLGKNKITAIQGLGALAKLRVMSIQSNRLLAIDNLSANVALEELYLSHNGIEALVNLDHLTKLTILDVGANRIKTIPQSMGANVALEDLWLNDNEISSFDDIQHLAANTKLETLYLERNPLASDFEYRLKIQGALASVQQIDATPVVRRQQG
ncbi:hypothetical protein SPRG_18044 [Saprolegnia parasitica CBS 223.65]|uniref:Protein phosphatase 1 regulatory subunit 7 n=1 Tax=Saprolegnia parasitica (strain CBS 223.65) TaxID=695850 RepID=A0A067BI64_SAPPC|nr:hypothetical protein SPRG_18044 [Saprolegnia parasitica CBS 223.65]KDO16430.1 hypothetical protein SPRG_18044 [Saprolegnia parasitica CBS 223.65]|eukprot:XP_012212862.1 hypothetical protein SPRG_18044 [Saprolegnia parasitica CBS 223.65]